MDRALHQQARAGNTGLACSRKNTRNSAHYRGVQISIVKHHIWRFAAKLKCHRYQLLCCLFINFLACHIRACKGDFCHIRMVNKRAADLGAIASNHIDRASRKACLCYQLHKFNCRGRGKFRWLNHRRITSRQRRCQLIGHQQ